MTTAADPVLAELRERIAAADTELVALVNRRLELVQELWEHKRATGLPLTAPDREDWLRQHLATENQGPLSDEGLASLVAFVLQLTKQELGE
jgi:chorismate mutase / prephenate dehydratase